MQLKRNKEMEFETLRKSYKKEIIIRVIAICVIGGALTFATSRAFYKVDGEIALARGTINYKPYDFKIMAMYKSEDGSNYNEINVMPESGYVINEDKTYCTTDNKTQVKGKIKTVNGIHGLYNISKRDKCYLYFEKKKPSEETLTKLNITNYKTIEPDFSQIATTDEGVYAVEDGMYGGTSYYWRGATDTNYIKFAGFCWRIVRINGDGSLRLIYDGSTCHANGTATAENIALRGVRYNGAPSQSNRVGWTYSGTSQRTMGGTDSDAKSSLENWFDSYISETSLANIAEGKYCNDRDIEEGYSWSINGTSFNYAAVKRYQEDFAPSLSCNLGDIYSLKVGLITADEVIYAGGNNKDNKQYYLYNGQSYWTMSPSHWDGNKNFARMIYLRNYGRLESEGGSEVHSNDLRPVINLKSDVTFSGGTGTQNNPYIVAD